jgi:AI-2 transport protein TqsA
LLNYIPTVGSLMAAIPGVLLTLVQYGIGRAIIVLIGYVVINVAVGNFLEPRVMGMRLGLSPMIIVMSLVFWGWILGPVGMLLSVPLTMAFKIALESVEETRGIALLLGSSVPKEEEKA